MYKTTFFLGLNQRFLKYNGCYYKGVLPTANDIFLDKNFKYFVQAMNDEGFIPQTTLSNMHLDDFCTIYKQYTEHFYVNLCHTSPLVLKEAALLYIRFNKWLYKKSFALCDGHTHNIIIQKLDTPYWCDLGSIVPLAPNTPFIGLDEFLQYFFYPLLLRKKCFTLGKMMRWSAISSISHSAAGSLRLLDEQIILPQNRWEALEKLENIIEHIDFPWEKTMWSEYDIDSPENAENTEIKANISNRVAVIQRLLRILKPKTVVDLGANAGFFSRTIARLGAEVLAIEPDEAAASHGHIYLQNHKEPSTLSPIKFSVNDVRINCHEQGDLAVAFAITHHLYLSQQYTWKSIANVFANHTTDNLITEFMPHGLHIKTMQPNLPKDYNVQNFADALSEHFMKVEIVDYPFPKATSPRVLLLCTNKKQSLS